MGILQILGIIPARGGSKGIPRKNIKLLGGKPLIAWTIEAAHKAQVLDRLILTTDDEEIAEVGRRYGCEVPFLRPQELAFDDTPGIDPILHAVNWLEEKELYKPDFVMLLQPTSPFRTSEQLREVVKILFQSNYASIVSVVEPHHPPEWMYKMDNNARLAPFLSAITPNRRQDLHQIYALNGAIYLSRTEALTREKTFMHEQTIGYPMNRLTSIDLDDQSDWVIAESLVERFAVLELEDHSQRTVEQKAYEQENEEEKV